MDLKQQALKEKAIRVLENRYKEERQDLLKFIQTYFKKELKKDFFINWHYELIADKLYKVLKGDITRLIINIPPRHGKTELITKCFPVWTLGNQPDKEIIATGYSTTLTQDFSSQARDYYNSETFRMIFPRHSKIRKDQDTKEHWKLEAGGGYYATGTGGSITGKGANLFIIDDPLKPDEAESPIKRTGINNWFANTVTSRLNNPLKDAIIIIMQRTHEDDLCGHLISEMKEGTGDDWEVISLPAIAEENDNYRQEGEALFPQRFPIDALCKIKSAYGPINFNCQYQQNPISAENQEFFKEWFKYYHEIPTGGRIFTTVDPAFSKKDTSDSSAITTVKFDGDKIYVLEQTVGKFDPAELEDEMIRHIKKWRPEKIGVEAFQAQTTISFSLRNRLYKEKLHYTQVEEIRQSGDKEAKIRSLIPLYRNGQIYHNQTCTTLEDQLLKFPRGRHDDAPDSLQMSLYLYDLMPNTKKVYKMPTVTWNKNGMPVIK